MVVIARERGIIPMEYICLRLKIYKKRSIVYKRRERIKGGKRK